MHSKARFAGLSVIIRTHAETSAGTPESVDLRRISGVGGRSWGSPASASPASTSPRTKRIFSTGWRAGFDGEMHYMSRHGTKRSRPAELLPGTVSCLSVRMDYWPADAADAAAPSRTHLAYVSRYALGRDYHKLMRSRLLKLCGRIAADVGPFGHRVFADSAPVLEKALARNAGLGWIGKHTNLIDKNAGSYFFLGEIYLDLELPADPPGSAHCGSLRGLPAGLPDRRHRRALPARCAPLHLLSDHRAQGRDPARVPPRHRQPDLRLRRLPAGLPLEQVRAPHGRGGLRACATGSTTRSSSTLFAWSEAEFLSKDPGQRDPPDRL